MRSLDDLIELKEPAWPMLQEWFRHSTNPVEVLPASDPQRADALVAAQVTTRSPMGAIIYETGGLLIDHGWIRILGSGNARLPRTLPEWNQGRTVAIIEDSPPFLLVADDVLGGFFAVNGGGFGADQGSVYYFAPDTLEWDNTEKGYTDFIHWCLFGDLQKFYEGYRWIGWEAEVSTLDGDKGFSIYPPLWAQGPTISERDRRAIPLAEIYSLTIGNLKDR